MERIEESSLVRIEQKLDQIITKLEQLDCKTTHVENSCNKMDDHIGFVESVYENCRHPLNWLLQKIGVLSGRYHPSLEPLSQTHEMMHLS